MCSLLQKVTRLDGTCINAKQVFDMGTKVGGELLQLPTGVIQEGYKADFVTLDLNDLSLSPKQELFANVVYSLQPGAIKDVLVNGEIIVEEGTLQTVSEHSIIGKMDRLFEKWN
jgi:5-methylthioadenosine/S-adenosylhomocysteine deaminase